MSDATDPKKPKTRSSMDGGPPKPPKKVLAPAADEPEDRRPRKGHPLFPIPKRRKRVEPIDIPELPSIASLHADSPSSPGSSKSALPESKSASPDGGGREIEIPDPISARDLAKLLHLKPFQVIKDLMVVGVFTNQNACLPFATASEVAHKHGFHTKKVA
jgi:hypothetical protein